MTTKAQRLNAEQFLRFNEHVLGLVRTRVPLDHGLRRMAKEIRRGRLQNFVASVADDLESGHQLSEALEKFRPHVSDYYVTLVRAGEAGGSLAEIFHHIVTETRRQIEHRRAIWTALTYPAAVFLFAIAIVSLMLAFLVPRFKEIFDELGAAMPTATLLLVGLAQTFADHFVAIAVAFAIVVLVVAFILASRLGRPVRDALALNLPLVAPLAYNDIMISLCRCLGFLLERKVVMADALALTQSVLRNTIARRFVGEVREGIVRGERFSDMLDKHHFLPISTGWMIRLSEDRGDLAQTLTDLAGFYQLKQEHIRRTVHGLLEPLLIIGIGILIGLIVITLYLPLFAIPKALW